MRYISQVRIERDSLMHHHNQDRYIEYEKDRCIERLGQEIKNVIGVTKEDSSNHIYLSIEIEAFKRSDYIQFKEEFVNHVKAMFKGNPQRAQFELTSFASLFRELESKPLQNLQKNPEEDSDK